METWIAVLKLTKVVMLKYFEVLPAVESALSALSDALKQVAKKKQKSCRNEGRE